MGQGGKSRHDIERELRPSLRAPDLILSWKDVQSYLNFQQTTLSRRVGGGRVQMEDYCNSMVLVGKVMSLVVKNQMLHKGPIKMHYFVTYLYFTECIRNICLCQSSQRNRILLLNDCTIPFSGVPQMFHRSPKSY